MHFTKREILSVFLVLAAGLLSLGMWWSFTAAVMLSDGYGTLKTFSWATALATVFFVGTVVWNNHFFRIIGAVSVFIPGLLFVPSAYQLIFSAIAIICTWWSAHAIQKEIDDRIHFHFFRNVRSGQFLFVFSLSLALSSGFFSLQKNATWESLVSQFRLGEGTSALLLKTAGFMYPELKKAADDRMTVDEFLLNMQEMQLGASSYEEQKLSAGMNIPGSVLESLTRNSQALYLASGREQLSKLVGKPINGNEKIADVFSWALQGKVVSLLSGVAPAEHTMPQVVPFLLALFLFLTLLPLGSFFGALWIFLAWMLFLFFQMVGWIRVETLEREQEVLAA